jgi:hypothetical protein
LSIALTADLTVFDGCFFAICFILVKIMPSKNPVRNKNKETSRFSGQVSATLDTPHGGGGAARRRGIGGKNGGAVIVKSAKRRGDTGKNGGRAAVSAARRYRVKNILQI